MDTFVTLTREFEGQPLTTLTWKGRPAWVARQIGAVLGYAGKGKRLTNKILGEWNAEFLDGLDYAFLEGDELAAFRAMTLGTATPLSPQVRSRLLVLFESGLHLVLLKSRRPVGAKLRRFLADEVLPQLARRGAYTPAHDPDERLDAGPMDAAWTPPPGPSVIVTAGRSLTDRREERLLLQARTRAAYVDLLDRRFKVAALHRVVETLGELLEPGAVIALEVVAGELATGLSIESLFDDDLDPEPATAQAPLPFDRHAPDRQAA